MKTWITAVPFLFSLTATTACGDDSATEETGAGGATSSPASSGTSDSSSDASSGSQGGVGGSGVGGSGVGGSGVGGSGVGGSGVGGSGVGGSGVGGSGVGGSGVGGSGGSNELAETVEELLQGCEAFCDARQSLAAEVGCELDVDACSVTECFGGLPGVYCATEHLAELQCLTDAQTADTCECNEEDDNELSCSVSCSDEADAVATCERPFVDACAAASVAIADACENMPDTFGNDCLTRADYAYASGCAAEHEAYIACVIADEGASCVCADDGSEADCSDMCALELDVLGDCL